MKLIAKSILIGSILSSAVYSDVFDNNREGFLLSVGAGYSAVKDSDTSHALATRFKMGYGFNQRLSLFYLNDVSWYKPKGEVDRFITGASSIGVDYYFDPSNQWYTTASIGGAVTGNFTKNKKYAKGISYGVGIGYELMPHLTIEGKYIRNDYKKKEGVEDTNRFNFTVSYTWY